ncbi:hypothetical protein ACFE04_002762 [Oxalis oulophora]
MFVQNVLHMNVGDGENSYAKNSFVQEMVLSKTKPILEETIQNFLHDHIIPTCFNFADLGCSSGPNTLLTLSYIIDAVYQICQQKQLIRTPDFQVFLNDLPGNDFNSLFNMLPDFYRRLEKEKGGLLGSCFISGLPSSFHGRLFPSNSMHLIHSSYSVHWLSKVPEGLMNKRNIHIGKTSPPEVCQAYLKQFQNDFQLFLSLRSEEIVSSGRMILSFIGRSVIDPTGRDVVYEWGMLTQSLLELVDEGIVEEGDIDSFNAPFYAPREEEVKEIVQMEGSFSIDKLGTFEIDYIRAIAKANDKDTSSSNVANWVRAFAEPILANHFGDLVIEKLFSKFEKNVNKNWELWEKAINTSIVISLTKKRSD